MRTGSSRLIPSGMVRSRFSTSTSSSSVRMMSSPTSSSVIRSTSTLFCSRTSRIRSNCSSSRGISVKKSLISWYSNTFFFFLAILRSSFTFSSNFACVFSSIIAIPSFLGKSFPLSIFIRIPPLAAGGFFLGGYLPSLSEIPSAGYLAQCIKLPISLP